MIIISKRLSQCATESLRQHFTPYNYSFKACVYFLTSKQNTCVSADLQPQEQTTLQCPETIQQAYTSRTKQHLILKYSSTDLENYKVTV